MRIRLSHIPLILTLMLMSLGACSGVERGERIAADETAAMMEGRNAAREFLRRDTTDTVSLRSDLERARSGRLKLDTVGNGKLQAAFDSGFYRTIHTVNPRLHRWITNHK